ncbi:flagellar basal body P-ring formation chaperone FlgA [Ampullimonas aquatilis]|uniref:flagellar basal body P-ring formation chaperone FlgA n=1 Tax=Ampullimonas aquatilis TaxID=1341549 RepID=UPI003C75A2B9
MNNRKKHWKSQHQALLAGLFALFAAMAANGQTGVQPVPVNQLALAAPAANTVNAALSPQVLARFQQQLTQQVMRELEPALAPAVKNIEINLGEMDSRLRLTPCNKIEPVLASGARLWGRATVGLKCLDAGWTLLVPVQIKITGDAWVSNRSLSAGELISPQDLTIKTTEWTQFMPGQLLLPGQEQQLNGKVLARPVAAGQWLRDDMLRAPMAVSLGDMVRVVVEGDGFAVTMDARATSSAMLGQTVRVQTENGKQLSGVALAGKVVSIHF